METQLKLAGMAAVVIISAAVFAIVAYSHLAKCGYVMTQGEVIQFSLYEPLGGRFERDSPYRWASASYTYVFEGITYVGVRFFCRNFSQSVRPADWRRAEALFLRLRSGDPIVVWVKKTDPKKACISLDDRVHLFSIKEYTL